ncbi:MAG: class I SAM-dependent methyltransferase [Deltaproteobacteria bacterium]|nr:class I SAM-dependent methyltransferase [Deltaproteobacteria bacterium]
MRRVGRGGLAAGACAIAASTLLACSDDAPKPLTTPETRDVIARTVDDLLNRDAKNFQRERQRIAARQTAEFVEENMPTVKAFRSAFQLLSHSVDQVPAEIADGLWAEFGVYSGKTINHIASETEHEVHGFDSFEGLPEDWRTKFPKGTFKMDGMPVVRENVKLHKGWFDKSVPEWAGKYPGHMAFIHFDADLYSSTKTVLDVLADRIVPGTVLQFDEFFNYPGWKGGEYRAFMEFVEARGVSFEYIGYVEAGYAEQVAVRITKVEPPLPAAR